MDEIDQMLNELKAPPTPVVENAYSSTSSDDGWTPQRRRYWARKLRQLADELDPDSFGSFIMK